MLWNVLQEPSAPSYANFVANVDATLDAVIAARPTPSVEGIAERELSRGRRSQRRRRMASWALRSFLRLPPVQRTILFVHPVTARIRRLLRIPGPEPAA